MTQDEFARLATIWLERGTWTPKQAARLLSEEPPYRPGHMPESGPETGLARHILDLAESFPDCRTERAPSEWIAWAKDRGLFINEALLPPPAGESVDEHKSMIQPLIGEGNSGAKQDQAKKTRKDALALELDELIKDMQTKQERVTAVSVMARLKAGAGKGGCVIDVAADGDGLIWERSSGKSETIRHESLAGRVARAMKAAR